MSLHQPTGPPWIPDQEVVLKSLVQERGRELYKLIADQREVMQDRCGITIPVVTDLFKHCPYLLPKPAR
eukprot:12806369-Prorocentrum_lima.AAC.1